MKIQTMKGPKDTECAKKRKGPRNTPNTRKTLEILGGVRLCWKVIRPVLSLGAA